jgi:hypothetical protein
MRGVPALLAAALAGLAVMAPTARAEPAASGTVDACVEKPNAASPQGSHWFYHVDRASGRHCWHLREQSANAGGARIAPRTAAAQAMQSNAPAPASLMPSDRPSRTSVDSIADNASTTDAAAPAPSVPTVWQNAPAPSADVAPAPVDDVQDAAPAPEPQVEPRRSTLDIQSSKHNSARAAAVERPTDPVVEPPHLPALLGAALALVLIIIGSLAVRSILRLVRRRPRRALLDLPEMAWDESLDEPPALPRAVPGVAAVVSRRGDIVRDMLDPHATTFPPAGGWNASARPAADDDRRSGSRRRDGASEEERRYAPRRAPAHQTRHDRAADEAAAPAVPPSRDAARILEDNVRNLLHRLQSDLRLQSGVQNGVDASVEEDVPAMHDDVGLHRTNPA